MRDAFFRTLMEVAAADERVALVVGDLGFSLVEPFAERFAARYVNAGVAEQAMTGIAAGLAHEGMVVFTYSIGNFATLRCLEQIRNDVCYHGANVKIVSVGGGLGYGPLGFTHFNTEDIAVMRALPEMTVVAPGDPHEVEQATRALVAHDGPAYLRLGRAGEPVVHAPGTPFRLGDAIEVREGGDVTLISTGGMLPTAVHVAEGLAARGIEARVLSMHTVHPLDVERVLAAAAATRAVVTLEEHTIVGGLGGAVAEVLAEAGAHVAFRRIGLPRRFPVAVGSREHLLRSFGLSEDAICSRVEELATAGAQARLGPPQEDPKP